jgi:YfiH family protein
MSELGASHQDWLVPQLGDIDIGALMTTRRGGVSLAPYDSLNVRHGIGDFSAAVQRNQQILAAAIGDAVPVYLNQVHGATVVQLTRIDVQPDAPTHTADASVTTEMGVACAVQVADCLPVLFAATRHASTRAVGAAHAGWRGLAGGVLEATLRELCRAADCQPAEVTCWLGACIGPHEFEVGADVLEAFGALNQPQGNRAQGNQAQSSQRFVSKSGDKWLADLPGLARDRLSAAGVRQIHGGTWCTVTDASRFFSYRRDRVTGRMVAAVWLRDNVGSLLDR